MGWPGLLSSSSCSASRDHHNHHHHHHHHHQNQLQGYYRGVCRCGWGEGALQGTGKGDNTSACTQPGALSGLPRHSQGLSVCSQSRCRLHQGGPRRPDGGPPPPPVAAALRMARSSGPGWADAPPPGGSGCYPAGSLDSGTLHLSPRTQCSDACPSTTRQPWCSMCNEVPPGASSRTCRPLLPSRRRPGGRRSSTAPWLQKLT